MKKWKLGKNLNSYIQSQTTRKLSLFYGDKRRTRFILRKSLRFLFVATLTSILYLFCLFGIGSLEVFTFLMQKVGFSLGVLTFTSFLMKVGCSKSITCCIILIMRAVMTAESESSQMMMVPSGSSGTANSSGRPPFDFDLNLPASGEEEGDPGDIKKTLYQLELAKVQEQKMKLAERIRPLIEEEALKQNSRQELPSETAMVEKLISRMAGKYTRTRAANDPNAEMQK